MRSTDIWTEEANESRVWIDDVLLQDGGIAVTLSSQEPALPDVRNQSVVVPGRHGAYDFGGYFEPREFALNCVFPRQSYTDLKRSIRKLNGLLTDSYSRPRTVKLRFGDDANVYYNARLTSGYIPERSAERGFFTLVFAAHDPYAYSTVTNAEILWGSEVIDFTADYLLGTQGSGKVTQVNGTTTLTETVNGDLLRPIFVIKGSVASATFSANGKTFTLPSFTNTEWIIDGDNYEVLRNGNPDLSAMTGDFIEFINGDNSVNITGSGMNFTVEIRFRDRYM